VSERFVAPSNGGSNRHRGLCTRAAGRYAMSACVKDRHLNPKEGDNNNHELSRHNILFVSTTLAPSIDFGGTDSEGAGACLRTCAK
jgi:hypothetical protein